MPFTHTIINELNKSINKTLCCMHEIAHAYHKGENAKLQLLIKVSSIQCHHSTRKGTSVTGDIRLQTVIATDCELLDKRGPNQRITT